MIAKKPERERWRDRVGRGTVRETVREIGRERDQAEGPGEEIK